MRMRQQTTERKISKHRLWHTVSSSTAAAGFNEKHDVMMLMDFSGHDPVQIIYKLQLVYYLHRVDFFFPPR